MALKTVIKSALLFLMISVSSAQSHSPDIYHINFEEKGSFELIKYSISYDKASLKFFFKSKNSLKSPIFVYNSEKKSKSRINAADIKDVDFSDPWQAYWIYHTAKEKPRLYLYEYIEEVNCYDKYPVTIEFPPPPPHPGPVE